MRVLRLTAPREMSARVRQWLDRDEEADEIVEAWRALMNAHTWRRSFGDRFAWVGEACASSTCPLDLPDVELLSRVAMVLRCDARTDRVYRSCCRVLARARPAPLSQLPSRGGPPPGGIVWTDQIHDGGWYYAGGVWTTPDRQRRWLCSRVRAPALLKLDNPRTPTLGVVEFFPLRTWDSTEGHIVGWL